MSLGFSAATRVLRRQPASALLVIGALALGAAATITLFAFVSAVLLEPLPYPEPERLVWIQENHAEIPARPISYLNFLDWQAGNESFAAMATFRRVRSTFSTGASNNGRSRAIDALQVPASYFHVLGLAPALGRDFTADDDRYGAPLVAIVSHSLWQSALGGRADAVGATVTIDGASHVVVGVAPPKPEAPGRPEAWVLAGQRAAPQSAWMQRDNRQAGYVLARLKPGITIAQATADLQRVEQRIATVHRFEAGHTAEVLPLRTALYGNLRLPLIVSFGAVAVLLLIVCVNAANLLLIRSAARTQEFALRAALGAGTRHIVRHVVAESALFAALGTAAGVLLAALAIKVLIAALPEALLGGAAPAIGPPVVLFSAALMAGIALGTGLPSALRAAAAEGRIMGAGARATAGGGRWRDSLAVAQIALALALLICAALLAESMARLTSASYGFDASGVLTFRVLEDSQGSREAQAELQRRVLAAVEAVPGVEHAAIVQELPGLEPRWQTDIAPESTVPRSPGELINVDWAIVSGAYFDTLRIPLASGRAITEREAAEGAPVMVIDESLARRFWPEGQAVGKHIKYDSAQPIEIVGVAADMRTFGREDRGRIKIYTPYGRSQLRDVAVMVRVSGGEPLAALPRVRAALETGVPNVGVYGAGTLESELASYVAPRTLTAFLLGLFATVATALAALGVYGVVSYAALLRTRELVIRMALGARPASVVQLLLRKGAALAAVGIALGLVIGAGASRAIAGFLFGVSATHASTYALAAAAFAVVAVGASLVPAWCARKLDPALAMRET
ncbi:MAG TPA: ADOP family duplicated permease [Gammaproteobacteria bacterium]|nr:ADOP family duplicated permease [Gammaproteobacteria bacterium]